MITTLVDIHHRYRRGRHLTRFVDGDVYVYELDQSMIVGLNDHKTGPTRISLSGDRGQAPSPVQRCASERAHA